MATAAAILSVHYYWFNINNLLMCDYPQSIKLMILYKRELFVLQKVVLCQVSPGAHEPPKEHAIECHHNPNYVITFELNWLLLCVHGFK